MNTPEFHRFLVRHVSNIFELSLAIARNGATPESRFIMCLAYKIYHQVKYQRLNANTCIVAAILFSAHPYIDRTTVRSNTGGEPELRVYSEVIATTVINKLILLLKINYSNVKIM